MSGYGRPSAPPGGPPGGYGGAPGYQQPQGGYAAPGGFNAAPGGAAPGGYNAAPAGYGGQPSAPGGYGGQPSAPGGYGGPGYTAPPPPQQPMAQPNLNQIFASVDKDRSGMISVNELQSALSNGTWQPFNPETIRLMISMFDKDGNGTINFQEFGALWKYINDWQNTFRYYDRDNSGSIDQNELQTAIASFGFSLSPKFYRLVVRKFDRDGNQRITFDDFIQCLVIIQTLSAAFQRKDTNRNGWIQINYEEFMELVFSTKI
ncbi:programmed cell death protein 6-like isoform X1 [Bolinopsis microptera]|uniref:programmed cell death protein 6-like isoform X1 n=1 Tax=Bolinopsis microptera TaxID=2820187 RepID=UPI003078B850